MERILGSLLKSVTGVSDSSQHTCSVNYDEEERNWASHWEALSFFVRLYVGYSSMNLLVAQY